LRLEPLYSVRFRYPEGWAVELSGPGGKDEHHFYIAEGTATGRIAGRFRGANHPRRRTDHTFVPDFQGVIETEDGAVVMFDHHGYGRAYPAGRRQIVAAGFHFSSDPRYAWLNESLCVGCGEVRRLDDGETELVIDFSELLWEAPAE
jgi:Protein of unknown function (DUF3237)